MPKKQLTNTSPTKFSEKEMTKQVGCVIFNLSVIAWKNVAQLK